VARYFDGRRASPHEVVLRLTDDTLIVQTQDGATCATWPLRQVIVVDGPNSAGRVTLARRGHEARLAVADPEMLRMLASAGVFTERRRHWRTLHWTALVGASLVALAGIALLLDAAPRLAAPLLPSSWEQRLGDLAETALIQNHPLCRESDGQQALERLVGRLRAASDLPPVRIRVVDDPMVNAFTLPGGRVLLMRGLIDTASDSAELAGVIAHELGHVAHHDPTTLLLRQVGLGALATLLGWNDTLTYAGGIARNLVALSYSRRAEEAADAAAQDYLARAGLRADGLGRFFARLQVIEGQAPIALLATHPPTEARRAHATRGADGAAPMTDAEWTAVRRTCG
jgi:predicted Zn-dependent protease